jgi:FAD/FMN-containing dehydrogenase/DNA-binding GntR family transcriptional regulator
MADIIDITRGALHDQLAQRLRTLLVEGRIAPGAKLNERELCEALHVSRTPLREAIKRLAAEGLVDLLPNRGAVAREADRSRRGTRLRGAGGAGRPVGRTAATRASDAEIAEIRALHFEMRACHARQDLSGYYRLNARIHACHQRRRAQPGADADLRGAERARAGAALSHQPGQRQVAARRAGARTDGARRWPRATAPRCASVLVQHLQHKRDTVLQLMRRRRRLPQASTTRKPDETRRPRRHPELPPNELCETLARRLRAETRGEVLFDTASRGRYATDASIYQIMPVGVLVPTTPDDVATALAIARELKVPVLPRGGGTSQCGQTTGAALVVDCSKHLRRVLDVNVQQRTATVEPGLVLDHLNAQLKAHGLWYPVDVSTSAQATLGGMAGNNSCGSRSIAYGNMVHNVAGAQAWMADGEVVDFGRVDAASGRAARIASFVRGLADQHRDAIEAHWPKVLRRVGGYNLDIFHPQSERPYTPDGQVNLAHLLVGSEGTLAFTRSLTLNLAPLPRHKVLGIVNFTRFHDAMASAQHIVTLGPTAVELVDRTMVELALANPAFAPTMKTALIGAPDAILLVEFAGDDRAALLPQLQRLQDLMGDLGHPGSVVPMPDETAQKALWEVRKAGLNIMMSLKGDGKPVSFIEDCAVPLQHLAEYTDALTEVFARHGTRGTWYAHASVGTLHVRPILDMRTRRRRQDARHRRRSLGPGARYKGAYSGEHGDGLCRGEWIEWQFGPALDDAFAPSSSELDPTGLFNPGKIVDPPKMDDGALFRFPPPGTRGPTSASSSSRCSTGRPGTCRPTR